MLHTTLAYIDPGSGSILLQMFIGSVIGMGFFFREGLGRVFRALKRS